jgi:hypothetical protein
MLLFSFMAYRSPLEIRVGLVANPDTPPFSNRHHPVSGIAHSFTAHIREHQSNAGKPNDAPWLVGWPAYPCVFKICGR